jgi:hypothetical protein
MAIETLKPSSLRANFACANQSVAQEVRCTNSPEKPIGGNQHRRAADLPVTVSSSEAQQILI